MKRYNGLWEPLVSWENLVLAAKKARRGKRDRPIVQGFDFDLERNLPRPKSEVPRRGW